MPNVGETTALCYYCGSGHFTFTLKLIPSGKPLPIPKWLPQIKQTCAGCGKFKKFAVQNEELIAEFNQVLVGLPVTKEEQGVLV